MRRFIFGLLALIAGVVFWNAARDASADLRALEERGVVAVSEPIASYTTQRQGKKTYYNLPIVLKTPQGQSVQGFKSVSYSLIKDFKPGMQVKVRYLPDQPSTMAIVGEEPGNVFLYLAASFLALLGGGLMSSVFLGLRQTLK